MKNITIVSSTAIPLPVENIDTDQIIPARFLKATTRKGFGENLFADWRKDELFILNNPSYKGVILIAGKNFGCGSSREHAAWALVDYGFQVVISSFFADIFKNNALNNGLLPVQIPENVLSVLLKQCKGNPELKIKIDLDLQTLECYELGLRERFDINPYKKECLLNGYSDLDYLISMKDKIINFEKTRSKGE